MAQYKDPSGFTVSSHGSVSIVSIATMSAGVIALIVAALFYVRINVVKNDTADLDAKTANHEQRITQLKPVADSLVSYDKIAKNLHLLFDNQHRWETVLADLQTRMYKNMKVTSLEVGSDKSYTISAVTPNYTEYAKAYAAFTSPDSKKLFDPVQVVSVAKSEKDGANGEVSFTFHATLTPDALKTSSASSL